MTEVICENVSLSPLVGTRADQPFILDNISFKAEEGDKIALLGLNGAGKSTLLRLLIGVYTPTTGNLSIQGTIGGVLDNGIGFEPEASGFDNIYYRSYMLGVSKKEIDENIQQIIAFAELESDIHRAIKYYSSGMSMKLSFAISSHWRTDILLMDEVIGVGDKNFQEKAQHRINSQLLNTKILFLASHNLPLIKDYCNKGLLLSHGKLDYYGNLDEVLERYQALF